MKTIPANSWFQVSSDKIALHIEDTATLYYSATADNDNPTVWPEALTDRDVVINNIPRGLFLKLTVDAKVTD